MCVVGAVVCVCVSLYVVWSVLVGRGRALLALSLFPLLFMCLHQQNQYHHYHTTPACTRASERNLTTTRSRTAATQHVCTAVHSRSGTKKTNTKQKNAHPCSSNTQCNATPRGYADSAWMINVAFGIKPASRRVCSGLVYARRGNGVRSSYGEVSDLREARVTTPEKQAVKQRHETVLPRLSTFTHPLHAKLNSPMRVHGGNDVRNRVVEAQFHHQSLPAAFRLDLPELQHEHTRT